MSALLLDCQADENPIEFTHFDCWCTEEHEGLTMEQQCELVIAAWSESLRLQLHPNKRYNTQGDLYAIIGVDGVLDLVIMAILETGNYSVYSSDTMIEIYDHVDS